MWTVQKTSDYKICLISVKETLVGLNKLNVNQEQLFNELDDHYEVLSEAVQTILRKNGVSNAYELLKELSRGKKITKEEMREYIKKLDITEYDKEILLNLEPKNYIGLCVSIVDNN